MVAEAVEALHPAAFVASSHTASGWMLGGQDKGDVVAVKPQHDNPVMGKSICPLPNFFKFHYSS